MVPRGEVALIIVNMGLKKGIVSPSLFSASVMMVLVTTLLAPPLIKLFFKKERVGSVLNGNNSQQA
jgi:Kef-type K+ transport system membrane component KefB